MDNNNKRHRKDLDLFTNLPESLVTEILFRLPTTKVAVRTSVLSKAWQHRWIHACSVSVVDELPCGQLKQISFTNAIGKILRHSVNLRSFQLHSLCFNDQSSFQTWISVLPTLEKLERFEVIINAQGVVYPSCLLNGAPSLRKLSLSHTHSTLSLAAMNSAPNLTTLRLSEVNIVSDNPTVILDFPVLENIALLHVQWANVKSLEIRAPSLTTFVSGLNDVDDQFRITVVSPRLTSLVGNYGAPEVFITNPSSVESAVLNNGECEMEYLTLERRQTFGLRVKNLCNSFTRLRELDLSCFAGQSLLSGAGFHGNKVTTLRLLPLDSAEQLLAVLHAMPTLKFLVVNVSMLKDYDYEAMESVPSCIVSQLEEVVLRYFRGKVPQFHFARFLSANANQLKKLTLVTDTWRFSELSSQLLSTVGPHLSTFTRRSRMLEIDARAKLDPSEFGEFGYFKPF